MSRAALLGGSVLAVLIGGFVLFGGPDWLVRESLRSVLAGRIDAPDLDTGLSVVRLRNGRLWEDGHPDHCQILAPEAEGEVELASLWCPRVWIRGGILSYRERIDTAFVKPVTARFPRFELEDTTVLLAGETILHAERAELTRDDARVYDFRGTGITHRGIRLDEVALLLREYGPGVDVPGAVARCLGGTVTASVVVGEGGAYQGQGRAQDLDLVAALAVLGPPVDLGLAGQVDLDFSVAGRADDLGSARGEGSIRIRGLRLGGEPGALELLTALLGAPSDPGPFDSGRGRLELRDGCVHVRDGEVLGPRWGLRANGTIDVLRRRIDVEVVLFDRRRRLETIPVVGPLLQGVADALRERLVRARIEGPFDRVRVTPSALQEVGERAWMAVREKLRR